LIKFENYAYVLENGEVVMEDLAQNLINNDDIRKKYLGG